MNIELKPIPKRRGQRAIMVDGLKWGVVHMESNGPRGVTYYFREDASATYIRHPDGGDDGLGLLAKVWSDPKSHDPALRSIKTRLLQQAERLIAEGLLRHPADVTKAQRAIIERNTARDRAVKEQKDCLFLKHAQKALPLDISNKLLHFQRERLINEIIKAMRWAQHQ